MFTFTISAHIIHPTLLTGFLTCAHKLSLANPGWQYRLVHGEKAHLNVLDFTDHHMPDTLSDEDLGSLNQCREGEILVLLGTRQKRLAQYLYQSYPCSLLCVDERNFRIRDLVESTLRQRRYISPLFISMKIITAQRSLDVKFTPAETKVISGLRRGKTGAELSAKLFRSQKTISAHKRSIMHKLGVNSNFELYQVLNELA
ncbi:helix-turn-helix domain-containing protein [Enterobacter quasiroggenkampii]|uniref:helix-turn-helix domain-containing protein n=1 Tax=Enterobacter quasiroggenkampii TaxID=2497436 RepID=UPI0021D2A257|nr:LuxR C-terminal-related transcriptional regulator [Enterobacter quasiroggenkampii]MCU6278853.1 LuxR C-terminal-related transcriptional regulator [Enterobacter quasiroggenkampii]